MTEGFPRAIEPRSAFPHFLEIPTRWIDNDIYGHVNNVVFYTYFDTVINEYLISQGGLDIHLGKVIGVAVESFCQFRQSIEFPDKINAGLRVARLGNSSARYEVGLFANHQNEAAAVGYFVHVFVDRDSRQPVTMPGQIRDALQSICIS